MDFIKNFLGWICDEFKNHFWYFLLWTVGVYLLGSFTGILIPGYNKLIIRIGQKAGHIN